MKLNYHVYGTGKPIVLVHGWAMHSGIWGGFAQQLAHSHRVICVDLPGHGQSVALQPFELAAISAALARTLADEAACWLGWSLGATVALDFVGRYPDRVSSLMLLSGNPCFCRSPVTTLTAAWPAMNDQVLQQFAEQLRDNSQATLLRFLALQVLGSDHYKKVLAELKQATTAFPPPDAATLAGGLAILKQADLRVLLADLAIPVMAILGGRDTLVPVAVGEAMQQIQPLLQVQVLDKAAHAPFLSHPEAVLALVRDFLDNT